MGSSNLALLIVSSLLAVDASKFRGKALLEAHQFQAVPERNVFLEERELVALVFFYCIGGVLALAALLLAVCLMIDIIMRWRHAAIFWSCQRQVLRVQEALMKGKDDLSLCPYCVQPTKNTTPQKRVKFLCGHSYHLSCINKWFKECPNAKDCCPVCEVAQDKSDNKAEKLQCCECTGAVSKYEGDTGSASDLAEISDLPCDEAQIFILKSLHRSYPKIISEESVERWAKCNTELWLTELTCPRYNSIFTTLFKREGKA
mmetsp:Transcript_77471/g.136643  ORF Transcript_77471/g.136643 Transcript_77471/m.136643 type:complete len:259 (+) Transcript_77471:129-905(+)